MTYMVINIKYVNSFIDIEIHFKESYKGPSTSLHLSFSPDTFTEYSVIKMYSMADN